MGEFAKPDPYSSTAGSRCLKRSTPSTHVDGYDKTRQSKDNAIIHFRGNEWGIKLEECNQNMEGDSNFDFTF
jgi:hypothetical protein